MLCPEQKLQFRVSMWNYKHLVEVPTAFELFLKLKVS